MLGEEREVVVNRIRIGKPCWHQRRGMIARSTLDVAVIDGNQFQMGGGHDKPIGYPADVGFPRGEGACHQQWP
jgi:hypothetical protein